MTAGYVSIKESVLKTLQENLDEIRNRFGIETIGIFGSVSREEDTETSDIDVLYQFKPEYDTYDTYFELSEYLENLFGRSVDLVSPQYLKPRIKPYVMQEAILCCEAPA